jgi:hypothetical protein
MKTLRNVGHKDVVTHPLSHSDSGRAPNPPSTPGGSTATFGLHQCLVYRFRTLDGPREVALSHIVLRTFCDSRRGAVVTRERRALHDAFSAAYECFRREAPEADHAFLVSGVQHWPGAEIEPPVLATFRQYATKMNVRTFVVDLTPLGQTQMLLVPRNNRPPLSAAVWQGLVARLVLDGSPCSIVKGDTPLP